jgi:hypothetical protein
LTKGQSVLQRLGRRHGWHLNWGRPGRGDWAVDVILVCDDTCVREGETRSSREYQQEVIRLFIAIITAFLSLKKEQRDKMGGLQVIDLEVTNRKSK